MNKSTTSTIYRFMQTTTNHTNQSNTLRDLLLFLAGVDLAGAAISDVADAEQGANVGYVLAIILAPIACTAILALCCCMTSTNKAHANYGDGNRESIQTESNQIFQGEKSNDNVSESSQDPQSANAPNLAQKPESEANMLSVKQAEPIEIEKANNQEQPTEVVIEQAENNTPQIR